MVKKPAKSETSILSEALKVDGGKFSPEGAKALLKIRLSSSAKSKMKKLLNKNSCGTISGQEIVTLDCLMCVGQLIDFIHAIARYSLTSKNKKE